MASACRSAAAIVSRMTPSARRIAVVDTLIPKLMPASALSSSTSPSSLVASRFAPVFGSLDTMRPLHSAIASARLKSNIAIDTTCWSWLSQDFAVPR